jgi:hypothetical protein
MTELPMLTANTDGGDDRMVPLKVDLCVFETRSCLHVSSNEVKESNKVLLAGMESSSENCEALQQRQDELQ